MNLSSHIEDYLETIYVLSETRPVVRVKDISNKLGVSKPSVLSAIKILQKEELLFHEKYGYIELTTRGETEGEQIYNRHKVLIKFLHDVLGVTESKSEKDACRIEHTISPETFDKLIMFIEYLETTKDKGCKNIVYKFAKYLENRKS